MTFEADGPLEEPRTGQILSEVSNTVVRLVREHLGKGPTQARTVWHEDVLVTVLRGGFTTAEQTLYRAGRGDVVEAQRSAIQEVFEREMRAAVERLTGRRVDAFLSANHYEPDVSVEIFVLGAQAGDGAVPPPAAA
jgi:uncharacterized protein YbcI